MRNTELTNRRSAAACCARAVLTQVSAVHPIACTVTGTLDSRLGLLHTMLRHLRSSLPHSVKRRVKAVTGTWQADRVMADARAVSDIGIRHRYQTSVSDIFGVCEKATSVTTVVTAATSTARTTVGQAHAA